MQDFLTSRRGRVSPEDAGVVSFGARRVPGLRRSEVAQLAGISVEYYTRMERGNLAGVSEEVLNALATALRLDDAERSHLFDLAHNRPKSPAPAPALASQHRAGPSAAQHPAAGRRAQRNRGRV